MTFDDDIYDDDFSPSRDDDDGPALRPGYVPLPPLENGGGTGGTGIDEGDPETLPSGRTHTPRRNGWGSQKGWTRRHGPEGPWRSRLRPS